MTIALEPYRAVDVAVGFIDRSSRARMSVGGVDRARFLHNLTTNDVKRLVAGRGCEAFVTSPQGKTLGYVTLLACDDRILLRTDADGLREVLPHLEKYGVFDDVVLEDSSAETFEFHLVGPSADEALKLLGGDLPGPESLSHCATHVAGCPVRVIREAPTGRPGLTVTGRAADAATVLAMIRERGASLGLVEISPEVFDVLRIEAGTPVFGRDVDETHLPQEVGRDTVAINFVKGCYLGQETVARIDALGHVNKCLRGLRLDAGAPTPPAGTPLEADGKRVGTITSSAFSPGWRAPVALAYVRTSHASAGSEVHVVLGAENASAVVVDLPMRPLTNT